VDDEAKADGMKIEVVAVDGVKCVFALFVKLTPNGGALVSSNANGLSREGAITVLRDYADALESGRALTHDG
jgi:hypothetical protein